MGTEIEGLIALARAGFEVVPFAMEHGTAGPGWMHMNGKGLRFEPHDKSKPVWHKTWEEFDKGV